MPAGSSPVQLNEYDSPLASTVASTHVFEQLREVDDVFTSRGEPLSSLPSAETLSDMDAVHPPGRRRLRSAVRPDGFETWTIEAAQYEPLRALILRVVGDLDDGGGVELKTLIEIAGIELANHPRFPSGRFTNWIRFVKVDLECEGVIERVGRSSPQRVRLTGA